MAARRSPLAGVLAVAFMVGAFALAGNSPDTQGADAKIVAYYADNSNQTKNIIAFLLFTIGLLFLITFFWVVRERLAAAGSNRAANLAFGAGVASVVWWLAAVAMFTGPAFAADDTSRFKLDPNTYRLINDMGYAFWVAAVMSGALVVWAASSAALRSVTLPRWFGQVGIVVGILLLFAVFFIPAFIYWAWILVAAVLLARAEAPRAVATPVAAAAP